MQILAPWCLYKGNGQMVILHGQWQNNLSMKRKVNNLAVVRKNYRHLSFYHSYVTLNCHLWKNSMQQLNWFCSLSLYHNYLSIVRMHERIYCQKFAGDLVYPIKRYSFSDFWSFFSEDTEIFRTMKVFCQQNITLIIWYSQLKQANRRQKNQPMTGLFLFPYLQAFS